jgi:hypothetical protein
MLYNLVISNLFESRIAEVAGRALTKGGKGPPQKKDDRSLHHQDSNLQHQWLAQMGSWAFVRLLLLPMLWVLSVALPAFNAIRSSEKHRTVVEELFRSWLLYTAPVTLPADETFSRQLNGTSIIEIESDDNRVRVAGTHQQSCIRSNLTFCCSQLGASPMQAARISNGGFGSAMQYPSCPRVYSNIIQALNILVHSYSVDARSFYTNPSPILAPVHQ